MHHITEKLSCLQGWYIVTYALGIYHLNLFIAFLTPKIDPAMDFDGKQFDRFYIIISQIIHRKNLIKYNLSKITYQD